MTSTFSRAGALCLGSTLTLLALLAFAGAAKASDAAVIDEKQLTERVLELTISTDAFSEPTKVHVNLPTGYNQDPNRRWPVTYVLAGMQNTYASFNKILDGAELTKDYPSIVVSPNGDSGFWSDWYNGGKLGAPKYETYVIDQLIPLVDARYRTLADRPHRAITGVSMGGYGAMMMAARHPDLFAHAASISGAVDSNQLPISTVISIAPTLQGGTMDSIYGPRLSQEVRWRGHNPFDLADNLRSLNLQVRTANGILDPSIGEDPLSADAASCVVESGVYQASLAFNSELDRLDIPHAWKDYGNGCHTKPNFKRETVDTLNVLKDQLANPPADPAAFDYRSIDPEFDVWGWEVKADPRRALEFLQMRKVTDRGLTLIGSGRTTVTSPPIFKDASRVDIKNGQPSSATPDAQGRIQFTVDLGAPATTQQFTLGTESGSVSRSVTFTAHQREPSAGRPKKCVVPKVWGLKLRDARKRLRKAHCRLGRVQGKRSAKARIKRQHPKPKKQKKAGTKVRVVIG